MLLLTKIFLLHRGIHISTVFSHVYVNSKNIEIKTHIFQNDLRYIIKMNINNICSNIFIICK